MKKTLITGATGNVGIAIIKALDKSPNNLQIVAGIRDIDTDPAKLSSYKIDSKDKFTKSGNVAKCPTLDF